MHFRFYHIVLFQFAATSGAHICVCIANVCLNQLLQLERCKFISWLFTVSGSGAQEAFEMNEKKRKMCAKKLWKMKTWHNIHNYNIVFCARARMNSIQTSTQTSRTASRPHTFALGFSSFWPRERCGIRFHFGNGNFQTNWLFFFGLFVRTALPIRLQAKRDRFAPINRFSRTQLRE